jgi:hypothetical protein
MAIKNELLPYIEVGNPKGVPVVFISGFPDDQLNTFSPLINPMKKDYRIVSCCLPDYQLTGADITKAKPWGKYCVVEQFYGYF